MEGRALDFLWPGVVRGVDAWGRREEQGQKEKRAKERLECYSTRAVQLSPDYNYNTMALIAPYHTDEE